MVTLLKNLVLLKILIFLFIEEWEDLEHCSCLFCGNNNLELDRVFPFLKEHLLSGSPYSYHSLFPYTWLDTLNHIPGLAVEVGLWSRITQLPKQWLKRMKTDSKVERKYRVSCMFTIPCLPLSSKHWYIFFTCIKMHC